MGIWCHVAINYTLDRNKHFSINKAIHSFLRGHDYTLKNESETSLDLFICQDSLPAAKIIDELIEKELRPHLYHVQAVAKLFGKTPHENS